MKGRAIDVCLSNKGLRGFISFVSVLTNHIHKKNAGNQIVMELQSNISELYCSFFLVPRWMGSGHPIHIKIIMCHTQIQKLTQYVVYSVVRYNVINNCYLHVIQMQWTFVLISFINSLRELPALIFRNLLHFKQIYIQMLYIIYLIYVNIIIICIFC